MMERKSGHIVGISSLASTRGFPLAASYSATKAAQRNFLESLRVDLKPHGISVTTILPGFFKSKMTEHDEFSLPFLMDLSDVADKSLRAIAKKKGEFALPRLLKFGLFILRLLPTPFYDFLVIKEQSIENKLKPRKRVPKTF